MRDAGFGFLEVGLQSIDDTALATVERRLRLQRFLDGAAALARHGLHWELQLIYGGSSGTTTTPASRRPATVPNISCSSSAGGAASAPTSHARSRRRARADGQRDGLFYSLTPHAAAIARSS